MPPPSNVVILIGADTALVDESVYARTLTPVSNVARTTANTKFGAGAITFDGTTDRLTAPNSTDFQFGNGEFTVEGWFRFLVKQNNQAFCGVWGGGGSIWYFYIVSSQLTFTINNGAVQLAAAFVPTLGQWYHIAVDRSGLTHRIYVDGVVLNSSGALGAMATSTEVFVLGAIGNSDMFPGFDFNGQMDEIRITKGLAQYGGAFTPPSAPFSRGTVAAVNERVSLSVGLG